MKIQYYKILLKKRFPLKISRGVEGNSYNVFISIEKDGITGWGEAAPGKNENADSPERLIKALQRLVAREFIGNIRQPIPLWLTSMEDMVDNLHNSCFDNIILVPRNKQGQSEAALLAKGLELIKSCPNLLFDLHAYEKWLVDQSEANIWQRIQRLQSHPLC
jgi:hypothetical protein